MTTPQYPKGGDRNRGENNRPKADSGPRINHRIIAPSVRLIDHTGENVGVVETREAIRMAEAVGLDLVEIVPNSVPPVAKIINYGKYKYEAQKKLHEARKKQKVIQVKELKLRPMIDDHDLGIKVRNAERFLSEGDKVRFSLKFRGREMAHKDLGMDVLKRVLAMLEDKCRVEQSAKMEGSSAIMIIGPK